MIGKSKFEYGRFLNGKWFAVSKQRYTKAEAIKLYRYETARAEFSEMQDAAVRWGLGLDGNGKHRVKYWLLFDRDGTEKRCCPVWAFKL